jgi:DNA-binding response OmpR family regulator
MTTEAILEPIKVLLVEDSVAEARLLYEGLTEALPADFQMAHVRRLSEALEWLWAERCDVILLDLGLPDSHGLSTLTLTRAQVPKVPIVVLTGFDDEAVAVQALEQGAQDYLVKGQADGKLLARSLRYAVARGQAEEALVKQLMVTLARQEVLQRSRQRLIAAQEGARREIAARLRTEVQQRLLAVKGRLQKAQGQVIPSSGPTQLHLEIINELDRIIRDRVELISQQLYPSLLDQGLVPALRSLVTRFDKDLTIEMEVDGELAHRETEDLGLVPEAVRLAAYRIAEEALANVVKQGKATRATLEVSLPSEGQVRITVWDNGPGLAVEEASQGLEERAGEEYGGAVGGDWMVRGAPGGGTETVATLPLAGLESQLVREAR